MKSEGLKNAVLVVLVAAIPVAYYSGGVSGFSKGYSAALFEQSGGAGPTVFVLRKLRGGDAKTAIEILELQLDSLVVQNKTGRESFRSCFNLPRLAGVGSMATIDKGASSVVAYRAQFPSPAQPPLKAVVDSALTDLARHAREKE